MVISSPNVLNPPCSGFVDSPLEDLVAPDKNNYVRACPIVILGPRFEYLASFNNGVLSFPLLKKCTGRNNKTAKMVAKLPRSSLNQEQRYWVVSALLQGFTDIYGDCHISNNLAVLDFSLASPPNLLL